MTSSITRVRHVGKVCELSVQQLEHTPQARGLDPRTPPHPHAGASLRPASTLRALALRRSLTAPPRLSLPMDTRPFRLLDDETPPHGAVGRRLLFALTRTKFFGDTPEVRGAEGVGIENLFPAIDLVWAPGTQPNRAVVEVQSVGEAPEVIESQWLFAEESDPEATDGHAMPKTGPLGSSVRPLDKVRAALLKAIRDDRRDYISKIPDPTLRRYHEFFLELDEATNSDLVAIDPNSNTSPALLREIKDVSSVLASRIKSRISALSAGMTPNLQAIPYEALERLSWLQRPMYERHFSTLTGAEDLRDAFIGFASGAFYSQTNRPWDGAPRSAMILTFAEFSIACIEAGIDRHFWRRVLPVHVMIQRVYGKACPTAAGRPNFEDFIKPRPDLIDESFLASLRAEYTKPLTYESLLERHAINCTEVLDGTL